ncbi:hypothetical protein [Streptomyces sp. SAS_272]|uniref:hypothetical protein n=1 Tax=Streptomyces sp. SAS_272 TaxID=3412747 RepID=UPI00403C0492
MARGEPTNQGRWPESGPVRDLLLHLDKIREANGCASLRNIAAGTSGLIGRNEIGNMLRGLRLPADEGQLDSLVKALGGGTDEMAKGRKLLRAARTAWVSSAPGSLYGKYVQQIAPAELLDRTAELDELAEFATGGPAAHGYLWWQAPAWAGKSALMSWFALSPPPKVDVVSFFVTARFAAHNDRWAFLEAVSDQLAVLGGTGLPRPSRELWEAHLDRLLEAAVASCLRRGRRLVLLVDGLDEDQGVSAGSGTYSIAALLPVRPPRGMRVVVAGRPHPPIPYDVPDDHPLRLGATIRRLDASPHAQVVRTAAERDLRRLLHGDAAGQDLLGLVTAAGGGLTRDDLAELTGLPGYAVEGRLHAATGRAFTTRPGLWRRQEAAGVYILAHEELRVMAEKELGGADLARHRRRLRAWADSYRGRGWPEETPEYLLTGYHDMLKTAVGRAKGEARAEAVAEMLRCAADRGRHDRMLEVSGGDAAAFAEIETAQDFLLAQASPDLVHLLRLAVHRNELADRNRILPASLPAAWALLGEPRRAEAAARSSSDEFGPRAGLVPLVEGLAQAGDWLGAQETARSLPLPGDRVRAFAALAKGIALGGDLEQAEIVACGIAEPFFRGTALAEVARSAAVAGETARAARLAESVEESLHALKASDRYRRTFLWCELAEVRAASGDTAAAFECTAAAERTARSMDGEQLWHHAYARLVKSAAAVGDVSRALRISASFEHWEYRREDMLVGLAKGLATAGRFREAQMVVDAIVAPFTGVSAEQNDDTYLASAQRRSAAEATEDLSCAMAAAGDHDRAVEIARALPDAYSRARALSLVARRLAVTDRPRGVELAAEAENTARGDKASDDYGLADIAKGLAWAGSLDEAARLAHRADDGLERLQALSSIARARAAAGDHAAAVAVARVALCGAGDAEGAHPRSLALADLAQVLTDAGDVPDAELAVRQIDDHGQRAKALITLAKALVPPRRTPRTRCGPHDRRLAVFAEDAERWALQIDMDDERCQVLNALTDLAAARGDLDRVRHFAHRTEQLARTIKDNPGIQEQARRTRSLINLGGTMASHGLHDEARRLAADAEALALAIGDDLCMPLELTCVADLWTTLGDHGRADMAIEAIAHPGARAEACACCIRSIQVRPSAAPPPPDAADSTGRERAAALATLAETLIGGLPPRSRLSPLTELAVALAQVGDTRRATARAAEAEELVHLQHQKTAQAHTLARLADSVPSPHRERMIAKALALGSWQGLLKQVAHLAPEAVRTLAAERFGGP